MATFIIVLQLTMKFSQGQEQEPREGLQREGGGPQVLRGQVFSWLLNVGNSNSNTKTSPSIFH